MADIIFRVMTECYKCGEVGCYGRDCSNGDERGYGYRNSNRGIYSRGGRPRSTQRGRGRGNVRLGRKSCYQCGREGHIAKDCGSGDNQNGCYNCGGTDHLQKDCPEVIVKTCYRCNCKGHLARNCTSTIEDDRSCYKCNKKGHLARDCNNSYGNGSSNRHFVCYKCNEPGHYARDCPNDSIICHNCQEVGHMARECLN